MWDDHDSPSSPSRLSITSSHSFDEPQKQEEVQVAEPEEKKRSFADSLNKSSSAAALSVTDQPDKRARPRPSLGADAASDGDTVAVQLLRQAVRDARFAPSTRVTTKLVASAQAILKSVRDQMVALLNDGDERVVFSGVCVPPLQILSSGAPEHLLASSPIRTATGVRFIIESFTETGEPVAIGEKPLFITLTESHPHAAAIKTLSKQMAAFEEAHPLAVNGGSGGNTEFDLKNQEPDGWLRPARNADGSTPVLPRVIVEFEHHNRSLPAAKTLTAEYFCNLDVQLVVVVKVFPTPAAERAFRAAALVYQRNLGTGAIDLVVALDLGTEDLRDDDKRKHFDPPIAPLSHANGLGLPAVTVWHRYTPTVRVIGGGAVTAVVGLDWTGPTLAGGGGARRRACWPV